MAQPLLEIQGHRGARGLKPENTLVGFETAFDLGVSAIETDLHLSSDDVPVVMHDAQLACPPCSVRPGCRVPPLGRKPAVRGLTVAQLRGYRVDRNPRRRDFPTQNTELTPLAEWYAAQHTLDPLGIPTLAELFAFAAAYVGVLGKKCGKTPAQQERVRSLRFDLELKRVPFVPETIGDHFDGRTAGLLEYRVLDAIRTAGVLDRVTVRSFDHRCIRAIKAQAPALRTALLIAHNAPVDPALLLGAAEADLYCPQYLFLDAALVRQVHQVGKRVLPWTVNRPEDWARLLDWNVDGLTTDFPDRLLVWLAARGISVM